MATKLYPWQEQIFDKITSGGFKPGEMMIMMSGRQIGKSTINQQIAAYKRMMQDIANRPVEELILQENRFAGARYYTVEPIGGNWMDMEVWCLKTFGPSADVWDIKTSDEQFIWPELGRWYKNDRKFWFRNEKDRTMFIMRWSR